MLFKHQNKNFRQPFIYLGGGEAPAAAEPQNGAANLRLNVPTGQLSLSGMAGALSPTFPSDQKPNRGELTLSTAPIIAPGTLGSLQIAAAAVNPDSLRLSFGAAGSPAPAAAAPEAAAPAAPVELPENLLAQNLETQAQAASQAILAKADTRFKEMIADTGQSRAISSEVGALPQGVEEAPRNFNLGNELTAIGNAVPNTLTKRERHFFQADINRENGRTFAYVLTHERGEKMGRLRVRNENLKLSKDRIEPGTKITILTNEPVRIKKVKDPQANGTERTLIYVKVEYKTKDGATRQNYVALDYLVSPFDHGDQPAPAPAAPSAPDAPVPAPDAPAPSPPPAPAAPVAPPPAAPAAPETPATPAAPKVAPAPAPPPAPAVHERETAQPMQNGDLLVVVSQAREAFFEAYVGENIMLRFEKGGQLYIFPVNDIVPKQEGKKIQAPKQPENATFELDQWYEIFPDSLPQGVERTSGINTVLVGKGVKLATHQTEDIGGVHYQQISLGDIFKGKIKLKKGANSQTGATEFRLIPLAYGPPRGTHNVPSNEQLTQFFRETLKRGEIPTLFAEKDANNRFYRLDGGFFKKGELVYVLPNQTQDAKLLRILTQDGQELRVEKSRLKQVTYDKNPQSGDKDSEAIRQFKGDAWQIFRERLIRAGRTSEHLPDIDPRSVRAIGDKNVVTLNTGIPLPKGRLVRIVKEHSAKERTVEVETLDKDGNIIKCIVQKDKLQATEDAYRFINAMMAVGQRKKYSSQPPQA